MGSVIWPGEGNTHLDPLFRGWPDFEVHVDSSIAQEGDGSEEMPFDRHGQPLASTLSDYMIPGPTELPDIRISHMESPSPLSAFGIKGIGEGGAIAPPAAIVNAVSDALAPLGVEITESPVSPRRILEAIAAAGSGAAA